MGMVCDVEKYPDLDGDISLDVFFHECHYFLMAECYDGTMMTSPIEHYDDTVYRLKLWKMAVAIIGGGTISLYRVWDKYSSEEDMMVWFENSWEVHEEDDGDIFISVDK